MQTDQIKTQIRQGIEIERQTGLLRQSVINLASVNDRTVTELDIQKVIDFVSEYIEHALALMQLIEESAGNAGALDDVQPILDACEEYFLAEDDIIPDHLGLVGLVDDAYLTHSLLQAFADKYKTYSGTSLLPLESHKDNAFVRRLIGEPFASILDEHVSATLDGPGLQQYRTQILQALGELNLSSKPDPVWGHAKASEIIDARIMAIGVF